MEKFNRKTYYITMLLGIINNNILTCMEDYNSQNTINTNNQALSLCSTNNNITIEKKNVDQQVIEFSEEYNDILIETLRDKLNNIFKEGQYDFQSIMGTFQNLGEKIFIPFVKKLIEKENLDNKSYKDKNGEEKYVVVKGEDWLGYEKKDNVFFYGHYKNDFDKVGVEINYKENSVFYGFWVNGEKFLSEKFLGVEFNKEGCFIGVYDDTKEKKTNGLYIKPDQIEIITQPFEPYIIYKNNFNIDNLKENPINSKKEYFKDYKKYIKNDKNIGFYLAKLKERELKDSGSFAKGYGIDSYYLLNESNIENDFKEFSMKKAGQMRWRNKYPAIEKKEIITTGKTIIYQNEEIGVILFIVFDQKGIYNVRIVNEYYDKKKEKKKKALYFIRDKFFELEQEAKNSSELRRYNIYLEPKEQYNTWIDVLNKKNQAKNFDLFFESYSVEDFKYIGTEKRQSKNICIFKNGTFMYKEPCTHLIVDKSTGTEINEISPCTLVNNFSKTYENGNIIYKINEKDKKCCFLKENYEGQKGENCIKTDENGEMKFLSNGGISLKIENFEDFTVYSCTKNTCEYNIYVKDNNIVKIFIFDNEKFTILYPREKSFSEINNKIEDCPENQNIIKSDDESDKENDNERQKNLYERICEKYELKNLCKLINDTQKLQSRIEGNGIKKYLLPENKIIDKTGKEIIDKTGEEIINKNVIKQKNSKQKENIFNKIDIKKKEKSEEENCLKIYTLIKGENELNKKVKNTENSWDIKEKNKRRNKKKNKNNIIIENVDNKVDNKVDNSNDNLHKNNDDYFFIESDCFKLENEIFFGEAITKNYVLHDWTNNKCTNFLLALRNNKLYNKYCDILSTLISEPSLLSKKKIHDNIFEARLNERYRFYVQKIDKSLYKTDTKGKTKQEVAKYFFLLYDNIDHIKYKKNQ